VLYSKADVDAAEGADTANQTLNKSLQDVGLKNREVLFVNDLEA